MPPSGCPDVTELNAFARGTLSGLTFERVAAHVEQCEACGAALARFDDLPDELLTSLRQTVPENALRDVAIPGPLLHAVRTLPLRMIRSRLQGAEPCRLGKFELLEELGAGSFGHVFRARDAELGRTVAIKVPRAGMLATSEDVERFLREARSAASKLTLIDVKRRQGDTTVPLSPGSDCIDVLADGSVLVQNNRSLKFSRIVPETGKLVWEKPNPNGIGSRITSRNGTRLFTSRLEEGVGHHLEVWDLLRGNLLTRLCLVKNMYASFALSDDGRLAATGGNACVVEVWDTATLERASPPLSGHLKEVCCMAFAPDGMTLAAGDVGGSVRLWNVATWNEMLALEVPAGFLSLRFAPDSRTLACATSTGSVDEPCQIILWHAP